MKLVIQPIMLDYQTLDGISFVAQALPKLFEFDNNLNTNKQIRRLPKELFDSSRNQYRSDGILSWLQQNLEPSKGTKVLAVCGFDAYFGKYNYCFGQAVIGGHVAAIYLKRLLPSPSNKRTETQILFNDRIIKESIHELGHTCGLRHCSLESCIMFKSKTIADTDRKGRDFCPACKRCFTSFLSHLK
jgi:archaemetzincin